jgi:preprotein translocase subunit SecE
LAEQRSPKPQVGGSSPSWRANLFLLPSDLGRLISKSQMNSKLDHSQSTSSGSDIVKYVVAALLVVAGLFFWFWFSAPERSVQLGAWEGQLRALAVVVGLVSGGVVFMLSGKGRDTREFLSESRFELRKVVWPTRQEAIRMTWVVVVVVIILSLLLGGFDFVIQKLTQWLLGR